MFNQLTKKTDLSISPSCCNIVTIIQIFPRDSRLGRQATEIHLKIYMYEETYDFVNTRGEHTKPFEVETEAKQPCLVAP